MENNTVFVLLAGGKSERMGVAKGLLKYEQTFWILEQLRRISETSVAQVFVGLGFNFNDYLNAIPWFKMAVEKSVSFNGLMVQIIINKKPELGSFSTLRTVIKNIHFTKNIIVNPIDTPLLNLNDFERLIADKNEISIPSFDTKKGHPIKMAPSVWNSLLNIKLSNENARLDFQLKKINPVRISIIEVSDKVILYNLNTPKEWKSYIKEIID